MKKLMQCFLFVVGVGFILGSAFVLYANKSKQATAHACSDLKNIGVIYCFDESNPNYMTIPLFENPNENKTFIRLKDEGEGLVVLVYEKKKINIKKFLQRSEL